MYPCSNPELVAAVSEAGGIGVVQPMSMTYVHGRGFREGLREIRGLTSKPIGFNAIVERSVKRYETKMREWVEIALEENVRFFVTALGNPQWVAERVHAEGGLVYHAITTKGWAKRALDKGVDGLICVNDRAGGHAGEQNASDLYDMVKGFGVPLVLAGGVGNREQYRHALEIGYAGVQMGTRFIASHECTVHPDYHAAIVRAQESDIVLTDKLSGIPVSVINTELVKRLGAKAGPWASWLLRNPRTKHLMRGFYSLRALRQLKRSSQGGVSYRDVFQAGKSAGAIDEIQSVAEIIAGLTR